LSFSGSNVPTEHTFRLTEADVEAAADVSCAQEWVASEPGENRDEALRLLKERDIPVIERPGVRFTTALRGQLRVGRGFSEKPVSLQAVILTHELEHYCRRDKIGDNAFDKGYAHSAGRWRVETPAYGQSIATLVAQGANEEAVAQYIDEQLVSMRDFYFLHDIDPEQYEEETRKIWEAWAQ
jgi:hypothetical protein